MHTRMAMAVEKGRGQPGFAEIAKGRGEAYSGRTTCRNRRQS
jgi:hypothetical protein